MNKEKTIFVGSRSYGNTFDEYWNRIMELESKCNKYKEILDKIKETMKEYKYINIEDYSSIMEFYRKLNKILEEIE